MLEAAGEVADGVHIHPIGEPGYLARHVLPNVARGATEVGRDPADVSIIGDEATVAAGIRAFADAGTTDFSALEFPTSPEEEARTRAVLKDLLG